MENIEEKIKNRLKNLPDVPFGLNTMLRPEDFHGVVEWSIPHGHMRSFRALNHKNAEAYHTVFTPNSEVSWHTHGIESREVIVCLTGIIIILFDDGTKKELNEKDILIVEKQIHHMAIIGDKPCEILAITIPKENGKK
jgi:quercetin dioxygenase-like cupin family protein